MDSESKWMAYDRYNNDYEFFKTEREAREAASKSIGIYADNASDCGWDIEPGDIGYCQIIAHCVCVDIAAKKDHTDDEWADMGYGLQFTRISDYHLKLIEEKRGVKRTR